MFYLCFSIWSTSDCVSVHHHSHGKTRGFILIQRTLTNTSQYNKSIISNSKQHKNSISSFWPLTKNPLAESLSYYILHSVTRSTSCNNIKVKQLLLNSTMRLVYPPDCLLILWKPMGGSPVPDILFSMEALYATGH